MCKLIALLFFVGAGSTAFARGAGGAGENSGSQYTHQAAGGNMEFTPFAIYEDITISFLSPPASSQSGEMKGMKYGATVEYGFNPWMSIGLGGRYESLKTTYTPSGSTADYNQTGLENPWVYLNAKMGMEMISFHLTGRYEISPGHETKDASGNYNGYSGAGKGTLGGSLELNSMFNLGVFAMSDVYKPDRTSDTTASGGAVTTTAKAGGAETTFGAFFETTTSPIIFGVAYQHIDTAGTKDTPSGGATTDNHDHTVTQELHVYLPVVAGSVTLIPDAGYVTMKYTETQMSSLIDKVSGVIGQLQVRLTF